MDKNIREKIGKRIREVRKQRGFTQEILAEKAGISGKFIGAIERGENYPSFAKLEAIATSLECDLRHFFEIDYLEETSAGLSSLIKKKLGHLSKDEKRLILKLIDGMTNR